MQFERIMEFWVKRKALWTIALLATGSLFSIQALAAQAAPSSMTVNIGTYNGGVAALAQANEGQIVNLYTNSKGNLSVTFKYSVSGLSSSLNLAGRLQQLTGSDIFTFQMQNSSGAWSNIGSTTGGTTYKVVSFAVPSSAIVNGGVSIRLISSAGADDLNLDHLVLVDSGSSTTTTTTTTTTSTTTTAVTSAPSISSFSASSASITSGQSSTLSWLTSNATSLILNPGNVNVTGSTSIAVSPTSSTTYTLTAANSSGSTSKSLTLSVTAASSGLSIPAGTKGYIQLSGTVNTSFASKVYDIDLFDTSASAIASLKQSGHIVICYFSAGTYENWRPDANQFPSSAIGSSVDGWAGENWLDIRNATVQSIMANRMNLAVSKGCNGVDPDNVDGYTQNSGFVLSMQDQINYNKYLAAQAHSRGLLIGLKNATELVSSLVSYYDFSVVEECFAYNECSMYSPFINQNKAVLNLEYSSYSSSICTQAASLKFSTAFYSLNLDGSKYQPCP